MRFLPVFLDLTEGVVGLVGSGPAALNKLRLLRAAGAHVRWFPGDAGAVEQGQPNAAEAGAVEICPADPAPADFAEFLAVVVATGDARDDAIAAQARRQRVPVNVVDRPELSTFIFPAIVDRGDVVVAISTGGASPVLARRLRERIEALLPARIGDLAALMGRFRARAAKTRDGGRALRLFWERVVDGPIAAAALGGRWRDAETALARAADAPDQAADGTVFIVGAGPGAADLLTLRALQALQGADVVFYDELIGADILDRARRDAERVFVGKRRGRPGIGQDAINQRLAAAARQGLNVVRLKGGDPFIFGRGGEELDYLRAAGVAVIVVPGISAALGCAAEAALPLSFRHEATEVAFVSAQHADAASATNWSKFTDPKMTLVVYMGLGHAVQVRDGLIAAGRDAATPTAVLARGTRADAACVVGRLGDIAALVARAGEGPALLVIGQTVTHSDAWRAAAHGVQGELAA